MHKERYKSAYTYRDWVINAFNTDMSWDTFVKAQLAGDLMDEKIRDKMIPGLGLNGLGMWQMNDSPPAVERADEWHDKVDATSKALLGLTVGCARCHDHKYDPIPQKDYYRMAGMFASTSYHAYPLVPKGDFGRLRRAEKGARRKEKKLKEFQDQLSTLEAQVLFSQTEDYMVAAWRLGRRKSTRPWRASPISTNSTRRCWSAGPSSSRRNRPTIASWFPGRRWLPSGGDADQAKTLAHAFYQKAVEIDKEHAKLKAENEEQLAKIKDPNEKFDPLPNGIKRKLIQHQIDLKGMDREASYLWKDMFDTDLSESPINDNAEDKKAPGLFKLTDWALQRRLSPDFAAHYRAHESGKRSLQESHAAGISHRGGLAG